MNRSILRLALMLGIALSLVAIAQPSPVQAEQSPCHGVRDYTREAVTVMMPFAETSDAIGFGERDPASISGPEWGQLAHAADRVVAGLSALTPPPAVAEYHQAWIALFGTVSNLARAMQTGGIFAALPYTNAMPAAMADLNAADSPTSLGCAPTS